MGKFKVGQVWKSRNGYPWRIETLKAEGRAYPIVAVVAEGDDVNSVGTFTADGNYYSDGEASMNDLVEFESNGIVMEAGKSYVDGDGVIWEASHIFDAEDMMYPVVCSLGSVQTVDEGYPIGAVASFTKDGQFNISHSIMHHRNIVSCLGTFADVANAPAVAVGVAPQGRVFSEETDMGDMGSMVDAPRHYALPGMGVEWIDVRSALLKTVPDGVPFEQVVCWSEAITYLARMWGKNGAEDLRKAQFYLKRMMDLITEGSSHV